tara:strand:+ start:1201 stop:1374 length:174 start_codon:yes stop_codon:yes gene_type:complete
VNTWAKSAIARDEFYHWGIVSFAVHRDIGAQVVSNIDVATVPFSIGLISLFGLGVIS